MLKRIGTMKDTDTSSNRYKLICIVEAGLAQ